MRRFSFFLLFILLPILSFARKQGQAYLDSLQQRLGTPLNDSNRARIQISLSSHYWAVNPDKGIAYAEAALKLCKELGWESAEASSFNCMATNYMFKADYQKAQDYSKQALQIYKHLGKKDGEARIYTSLCILYMQQSDYPKALNYGFKALAINEDLKDTSNTARDLTNIGIIYNDEGYHDKALEFHQKAEALYEKINDKNSITIGLSNIGLVYKDMKEYNKALVSQQKALAICKELGNKNVESKIVGYIGDIYIRKKKYSKGLQYLFKALATNEELGNKAGCGEKLENIGGTYLAMVQDSNQHISPNRKNQYLDSAMKYTSRAAAIHSSIGNIRDLASDYKDLSTAYEIKGNYKDALRYHKAYMTNNDSINNTEKSKQITELQTQYETKVKDKQIAAQKKEISYNRKINFSLIGSSVLLLAVALLIYINQRKTTKLNRQIITQKKELEHLNNVKDRMFSIISHDLRSPVNSLISFTQLLEHNNEIPPEKLQVYTRILKNNMDYTAGLMENLLNWVRTQMQGYKPVLERIDLSDTVKDTVALLATDAANKGIKITNNISANRIVYADMNMTSLLVRNLLSNAIKYTPQAGIIRLSTREVDNVMQLMVTDTGIGIAPELVNSFNDNDSTQTLESTLGTNKEKGTGLGLMLCKNFAALMNGKIILESKPGKGSTFTVTLPV